MLKTRFFFACIVLTIVSAACGSTDNQTVQVSDAWARPGLAGGNSAIYFVTENDTAQTDTLLSASSDIAAAVELHMTEMEGDTMQMMPQSEVPIPSGETTFQPGELHVMLIGLNHDLKPGDTFTVTLDFAAAGEMPLDVTVREP